MYICPRCPYQSLGKLRSVRASTVRRAATRTRRRGNPRCLGHPERRASSCLRLGAYSRHAVPPPGVPRAPVETRRGPSYSSPRLPQIAAPGDWVAKLWDAAPRGVFPPSRRSESRGARDAGPIGEPEKRGVTLLDPGALAAAPSRARRNPTGTAPGGGRGCVRLRPLPGFSWRLSPSARGRRRRGLLTHPVPRVAFFQYPLSEDRDVPGLAARGISTPGSPLQPGKRNASPVFAIRTASHVALALPAEVLAWLDISWRPLQRGTSRAPVGPPVPSLEPGGWGAGGGVRRRETGVGSPGSAG